MARPAASIESLRRPPFLPELRAGLGRKSAREFLRPGDLRERQIGFVVVGRKSHNAGMIFIVGLVVPDFKVKPANSAHVQTIDPEPATDLRFALLRRAEARTLHR